MSVKIMIRDLAIAVTGENGGHLVTRETGRKVRAAVAHRLVEAHDGEVVTLDFNGLGVIDYSCADEFVAKLLTRLIAGEYGDKYVSLQGLSEGQRENIEVALERKRLPTITVSDDARWECLGTIKPYLKETLDCVMARRKTSARDLCDILDIELNTSSTRLINLHRQRLVTRRERTIAEGGREYVYSSIVPAGKGAGDARI